MSQFGPLFRLAAVLVGASASVFAGDSDSETLTSAAVTPTFSKYDHAPATPDADDPAIWVSSERSVVIGTLKNAGLGVFDLRGNPLQYVAAPYLPRIKSHHPRTPAGLNREAKPCRFSEDGKDFSRFNGVDIIHDVPLRHGESVDIAVVSDRGCDELRFYSIDGQALLQDVTASTTPRVFPTRWIQPSVFNSREQTLGEHDNPLGEQQTAYGVTVTRLNNRLYAFVSQLDRSVVSQIELRPTPDGRMTYRTVRTFVFDTNFKLASNQFWTPCRDDPDTDPQSEGLVVDRETNELYVGFEQIGFYRIPLTFTQEVVTVDESYLVDRVKTFGQAYSATFDHDEGEYICSLDTSTANETAIEMPGDVDSAGHYLEADVEGLALARTPNGEAYLLVSSQGDDTFHRYALDAGNRHLDAFRIEGVRDTDGIEIYPHYLSMDFPAGVLVVQNGKAPRPSGIHSEAYEGSTRYEYIDLRRLE